jgi:serine/threonine protein kinase
MNPMDVPVVTSGNVGGDATRMMNRTPPMMKCHHGPQQKRLNLESIMQLQLDTELINDENDHYNTNNKGFDRKSALPMSSSLSPLVFRQGGISIGGNYLRIDGATYTRSDQFQSPNLIIHEMIGHGAFSTVYRATTRTTTQQQNSPTTTAGITVSRDSSQQNRSVHQTPGIDVAIKVWSVKDLLSTKRLNMLLKELRTLGTSCAGKSSLVQLHGAFLHNSNDDDDSEHHPSVAIVLEYMNRGSLHHFMQRYCSDHHHIEHQIPVVSNHCHSIINGLPESIMAPILYQILLGLQVLHERRIVHRDLKPANVLLNTEGYVKLCDFGISSSSSTHPEFPNTTNEVSTIMNSTVLGTTKFMSPERLRAQKYSRSSDIWSLGCIVYQCCTNSILWNDIHSIIDLLMTIEEMRISDTLKQLNDARFRGTMRSDTFDTDDKDEIVKDNQRISHGLQEILVGCLQIDSGTSRSFC